MIRKLRTWLGGTPKLPKIGENRRTIFRLDTLEDRASPVGLYGEDMSYFGPFSAPFPFASASNPSNFPAPVPPSGVTTSVPPAGVPNGSTPNTAGVPAATSSGTFQTSYSGWDWGYGGGSGSLSAPDVNGSNLSSSGFGGDATWYSWVDSSNSGSSPTTSSGSVGQSAGNSVGPVTPTSPALAPNVPMTLEILGWPEAPAYGQRNEKVYEKHSLTSTFTSNNEAYTIGITTEATYLTKVSTTGVGLIVTGDATAEFTFRRSVGGAVTQNPDPVRYAWHIDTTPGSTTATQPPVLTAFPFATQLAAVPQTWTQAEIVQSDLQLISGEHNDLGLEYAFTSENRSNSTTILTPGAVTANGVSVATARMTGSYSTSFQAGDWIANPNLPRQGWMVADNRTAGTFAQNQSVATEYLNSIAISQTVNADGRLDGTDSTHVALRAYFDTRTDNNNWTLGQVDRVIDSTGTTTAQNATDLKLAPPPLPGGTGWTVTEGSQSNSLDTKKTIVQDRLKVREDFKKSLSSMGILQLYTIASGNTGFDQSETATTAGLLTTKSVQVFHKPLAAAATDRMTESESFDRQELVEEAGANKYWLRNNWNVSVGGIEDTEGQGEYASRTSGRFVETSNSEIDFAANSRIDTAEWNRSGNDMRSLHDRGNYVKSQSANDRTMVYNNDSLLSGPFVDTGTVVSELSLNPALAALAGTTAMNSKITANTDSSAKLSGEIGVHVKSSGSNSFDESTDKLTRYGPEANTRTAKSTGLVIVNGIAQSGKVESEAITLGVDTIVQTQKGMRRGVDQSITEIVDLTDTWWGGVTVGTEETIITYNAAVPTIDTYDMSGSKGAWSRVGTVTINRLDMAIPNKSTEKTTWTPLMTHPTLGKVTGTFEKSRQMIRGTIGGVSTFGDYRQSAKTISNEMVERNAEYNLAAPDGRTGKETWDSKTVFNDGTESSEDQVLVAGVWNGARTVFDNFSDSTITGTHNKDLTVPAASAGTTGGTVGLTTGETVTKVRDSVKLQYHSDRIKGSRGRGGDSVTQKTTDYVVAQLYTQIDGSLSGGGTASSWDSTDFTTIKTDNSHNYDWANGSRRLVSSTIDMTRNRDFYSHRHMTTPTYWSDTTTNTESRYELSITGPVGAVVGMAKDYTHTKVFQKSFDNPGGLTIVDTTTGSPFRTAVLPMQIRWFDDTWVNAAWGLAADTSFGRGVSWAWNHGQDIARVGFGTFDLILGASMVWTGVGTLPGIGLIAIGLDQIATGSINIRYGRVGQGFSILEFGVYRATGSETVAFLAPGVFSLGFGSVGSLGRLGARGAGAAAESAGGFGMFGRIAPPPTGALSEGMRTAFLQTASSPWFRLKAGTWARLNGLGAIDWAVFMQRLGTAEFRQFANAAEAWKSLGWAGPLAGRSGRWLFGVPQWSQRVPGFGRSLVQHELFHGLQDFKYGLFAVNETKIGWLRAFSIEMAAHTYGGTGVGVGLYMTFGYIGGVLVWVGIEGYGIYKMFER